jgi:hypothetical protein
MGYSGVSQRETGAKRGTGDGVQGLSLEALLRDTEGGIGRLAVWWWKKYNNGVKIDKERKPYRAQSLLFFKHHCNSLVFGTHLL